MLYFYSWFKKLALNPKVKIRILLQNKFAHKVEFKSKNLSKNGFKIDLEIIKMLFLDFTANPNFSSWKTKIWRFKSWNNPWGMLNINLQNNPMKKYWKTPFESLKNWVLNLQNWVMRFRVKIVIWNSYKQLDLRDWGALNFDCSPPQPRLITIMMV